MNIDPKSALRNTTIVILTVIATTFVMSSCLSAAYLALYEFLRDTLGLSFWQVVILYGVFLTGLSTMAAMNTDIIKK